MNTNSNSKPLWLVFGAAAIAITPAVTAFAYPYALKVFDPDNFEQNERQVQALAEQIERESTQIELQELELAHQTISLAAELRSAAQKLNIQVATSFINAAVDEPRVRADLERRYPINPPGRKPNWLEKQAPIWARAERQRLVELAQLQNHVYRDLAPASHRLAPIIQASNGVSPTSIDAPGLTAVEQSRNELLAMWSAELDAIAVLRTVRALVIAERTAREQSEIAYCTARREALMRDWPTPRRQRTESNRSRFER